MATQSTVYHPCDLEESLEQHWQLRQAEATLVQLGPMEQPLVLPLPAIKGIGPLTPSL